MPLNPFSSVVSDSLKKLARREFASAAERDELLRVVLGADAIRPRDVMWMLFRPDRALREAGGTLLRKTPSVEAVDAFVAAGREAPEAALRAAASVLFELEIPALESRLLELLGSSDDSLRRTARRLILAAPARRTFEPVLWDLVTRGAVGERLAVIDRLGELEVTEAALGRWAELARDEEPAIRERALTLLATRAPGSAIDLFVEALPRAGYATQQHLIQALTVAAREAGPEFAERVLPLMASGDVGTRSAVMKILLGMGDRQQLIRRYLLYARDLAGWARDRALDSMSEFGSDLVEPAIELLGDPEDDVRASALAVVSAFDDPRVIPAAIRLLDDPDWWLRVNAADTLGRFRDPRAVQALTAALRDRETRWAAVEALGRIGDPSCLQALGQLLADPAPEIRIEVLLAFRNFKHPNIMTALRKVAASDPERAVRTRALEVAEEVAGRDDAVIEDADELRSQALRIETGDEEPALHRWLSEARKLGASDLHLTVGRPPTVRLADKLGDLAGAVVTADAAVGMIREILTAEQWARLETEQQLDLCYYIPNAGRFRANLFSDQRGFNAVFRVIPEKPPTIADIGLPSQLAEIADFHQGLVLVCGTAGSGKTTTLAALVNLFNETRNHHVITLEDPVEFVHPFKSCLVNQREVGADTASFERALRGALREDPDVIVIGDLRDPATMALALTAAETGHVVLATLDATNATRAIDRILASVPASQQPQLRAALSESLKYVIAQRLLPALGERRQVACFEVLRCTRSIANLIREEKTIQIPSMMQIGRSHGMQTFDEALKELVRTRRISPETAYMSCQAKGEFEALVSAEFLSSLSLV